MNQKEDKYFHSISILRWSVFFFNVKVIICTLPFNYFFLKHLPENLAVWRFLLKTAKLGSAKLKEKMQTAKLNSRKI